MIGDELLSGIVREYKGQHLTVLPDSYVVIDLETTGLDPQWNDIIELGAIRVEKGNVVDKFSSLVNPGYIIDSFITDLTGITNEMVASAPSIKDALPKYLDFVNESIVIGHNVNFDINFLYDNCMNSLKRPFSNDYIDTMRMSRKLFPQERHHRLHDLLTRFGVKQNVEHRALADIEQTNYCYLYMKSYIQDNGIDSVSVLNRHHSHISAKDIKATVTEFDESSPFYDKTFVFTGTLERMIRAAAMQLVVDHGGNCGDGVNKTTNFLVLGNGDFRGTKKDGKSAKYKKAEQLKLSGCDIEIISENVFYDMLE